MTRIPVGTKSLLFGAHCFFIHPWFVALGWWRLYGFPWDPRLWAAFIVHDWGYWGKDFMDDEEGERHPELGAKIMGALFDNSCPCCELGYWGKLSLYHSRYYAKRDGVLPSELCFADKMAIVLEPWWLYIPRAVLSGEIEEYIKGLPRLRAEPLTAEEVEVSYQGLKGWYQTIQRYLDRWIVEHKDSKEDVWTIERHVT